MTRQRPTAQSRGSIPSARMTASKGALNRRVLTMVLSAGIAAICGVLGASATAAIESRFTTLRLAGGIQVDVPHSWLKPTKEEQDLLDTSAEAALDLSVSTRGQKRISKSILEVFTPKGQPYCGFTITLGYDQTATQEELKNLTADELRASAKEVEPAFREMLRPMGEVLIGLDSLSVEKINDNNFLVYRYRYRTSSAPSSFVVRTEQYQYEDGGRVIMFIAKCDDRARQVCAPILKRSLDSLKIPESK